MLCLKFRITLTLSLANFGIERNYMKGVVHPKLKLFSAYSAQHYVVGGSGDIF